MKALKNYKILVVDDKPDNLRILVEQMENMPFDILAFQETSARNAIEIALLELPDLIVTDWEMPDMNGIEFIRALKTDQKTQKIPVIMCTGIMTSSLNLKTALDAGAVDFVRPVDPIEFEARIGSMLQLVDSFQMIEQQMKLVESQKEILLTEVHHRVKNNLQIIISLMNLQLAKIKDEGIEQALRENQSRIMSMSLVHQRMQQTANFNSIELKSYTAELIENVKHRFLNVNDPIDPTIIELKISNSIFVDLDTSIPLGLVINEIVSNFYKHARITGANKFTFSAEQSGNTNTIRYHDNGGGFPSALSIENLDTFGLELIEILMEQ